MLQSDWTAKFLQRYKSGYSDVTQPPTFPHGGWAPPSYGWCSWAEPKHVINNVLLSVSAMVLTFVTFTLMDEPAKEVLVASGNICSWIFKGTISISSAQGH